MKKNLLITIPKLSEPGGVSSFWNSLLPEFLKFEEITVKTLEIGGHKKNIIGPLMDQWNFSKVMKEGVNLSILNPSLDMKSFFRDGFFAKQLIYMKKPFVVFFHGWDLGFEQKIDKKYISFFLNSFGKAKKIFVLSNDFKDKILKWGYNGEVIVETTNIDSALIAEFSMEKKLMNLRMSNTLNILFLARLIKEKGVFEIVEAFEIINKKLSNIKLIIAGDGADYEELKLRVLGNPNIIVTGYVKGKDKINLYQSSHVYCLPSYSEGLPISVLEAMAFALPVVTTKVGGLKMFFKHDQMGYLVEPRNTHELAEKLELMLTNKGKIANIGKFNNRYVNEKLVSNVFAKRIYNQIEDLIL